MADLALVFEPPLARILLDRPERRNAMSPAMWRALPKLAPRSRRAPMRCVVIVEGAGGHFCAGADIVRIRRGLRRRGSARDYLAAIERGLERAGRARPADDRALEGSAIGGGLAVALACDLRFAAEDAHLAIPPAKLGLLYGPVETRRLVELVGPARAKDLLFSGRRVGRRSAGDRPHRPPSSRRRALRGEVEAYAAISRR